MFDVFLEFVKRIIKSRLFPITLIYFALFSVIIQRLFVLQIVEGATLVEKSELKYTKSREVKSTRGNIYDRNGKLLAYNELSYSVIMEDSTKIDSNEQRNAVIYDLIQIIEKNGDTLDNDFYIVQNEDGEFEFTIEGSALTRFKENAYAYLDENNDLKKNMNDATAEEVYEFLRNGTGNAYTRMFEISDEYSVEDTLKIMGIRYALFCNYPKYVQITVASNVSDTTVAAVRENNANLPGVEIQQQTHRIYNDSYNFAHILGYTGLISSEELEEYNADSDYYNSTDMIGKTGLEKEYESYLGGTKGSEIVSVNTAGKVVEVLDSLEPVAGNDVYLTIDGDLQHKVYQVLEKKIASIVISRLRPDLNYGSKGESAAEISIPIYEVYYALINNNIIDINSLNDNDSTSLEKQTYAKFLSTRDDVFKKLDSLLSIDNTITNNNTGDMEDYLDYFYSVLISNDIILSDHVPEDSAVLSNYKNDQVSLSKLLQYAIANNWVDLSKLEVGDKYYSAEELYNKLITYTKKLLEKDDKFNKNVYRNLVFSYKLSGSEICLLLFNQGVLEYNEDDINQLKNGYVSAFQFMKDKMTSLEITPAMLALEPCSGSVIVTDVNTGDVLALVTYPSYDNNRFANKIDSKYYAQLLNDKSYPLINRPVMQRTAPGSTFKMVTSFAALEEGVTTPTERIHDEGLFDKTTLPARCHIYPGSHGSVNISDALKVSCNYFFYEMGWRLSLDSTGRFKDQLGLSKLEKYAALFGFDADSGIELNEATPGISNDDAVRSAIGQGTNDYTPSQLARYVTTLANRGTSYNLTLLDKIVDKDGKTLKENNATVHQDLTGIRSTTWDAVLDGMYAVVNENEGSVFNLYRDLGMEVAGKTGTSQISKVSPSNALFVSFAPYNKPEISVTVVIPNGYTSSNAAALAKDIYKLYFKLDGTEKILDGGVSTEGASTGSAFE